MKAFQSHSLIAVAEGILQQHVYLFRVVKPVFANAERGACAHVNVTKFLNKHALAIPRQFVPLRPTNGADEKALVNSICNEIIIPFFYYAHSYGRPLCRRFDNKW